jgi:hypothetical protein
VKKQELELAQRDSHTQLDGNDEDNDNDLENRCEEDVLVDVTRRAEQERIELELHIVYSRTYHVPQLLIRAWDQGQSTRPLASP